MRDDLLTPPPEAILQVTALTRLIKRQLEANFARVWVQGEVSNLRRQSSGHLYFSLKDAGSQLPCALFARDAARQSFELADGMEVLLLGDISVFEPHGRYQLIAKIAIEAGAGRLQLEFERLKRKLAAEGLFDAARKKPLPTLPRRIAVITSPSGAAVQDFLRILIRRGFTGDVVIFPALVQGAGAAADMIRMLERAAADPRFDLLVLTRGGGSIEDLWAFNEEALARAVAQCPLPTLSAVGHEIDTVLTDFAADRRAETPSGAAELISSCYLEAWQTFEAAAAALQRSIERNLRNEETRLRDLRARLRLISPDRMVQHLSMRLDERDNRLRRSLSKRLAEAERGLHQAAQRLAAQHPRSRLALSRQQLRAIESGLRRACQLDLQQRQQALAHFEQRLATGSLPATLRRGFSILQDDEGRILDRLPAVLQQTHLRARLQDGTVALRVEGPCEPAPTPPKSRKAAPKKK